MTKDEVDTGDLDSLLEEALKNIISDREHSSLLLTDIILQLKSKSTNHKDSGLVAAKYVETLQRSNEQLIKITSLLSKLEESGTELDESDKEALFETIQEDKNKGKRRK